MTLAWHALLNAAYFAFGRERSICVTGNKASQPSRKRCAQPELPELVNVLVVKASHTIMNATAIVTFPDPERAFDALKAIEASSGSISAGSVVATKDLNGNLLVTETTREKIGSTMAGAFIGGLAGLPLGAVATIFGAAASALIGAVADLLNRTGEAWLDRNIGRELRPGETALVIDVSEKSMADFETLMKSAGGTITCTRSLADTRK